MNKTILLLIFIFSVFFVGNAQSPEIGIVGPAANGWPPGPDGNPTDIMLTNNGDGTYSIDALTLTTGPAKFREDQAWTVSYGGDQFPSGPITNGDIPVQAGVYDILLDLNNNTYTFTDVGSFTEIELAGSATTGSNPELSTTDGENYELGVTEFQDGDLVFQEVGTSNTFGAASFPSGTATAGGANIPVVAGFYEVTFNLNTGDYSFDIPDVGLVGPGITQFPDASNPTPDVLMNTTDGNIYTLSDQVITDGLVKFRQNQDWAVNWGSSDFPSGDLVPGGSDIQATAGTYDITFNRSALTFDFQAANNSAEVQIIHNAADPAAQFVDVYLNGNLIADDFEFRNATSFLDVPADTPIDIDIAPQNSTDVSESIFNLNTTLTADETYIAVANGVIDPTQFDSSVNTIDFGIDVFAGAQQTSTNSGEVSVLVNHGSTDAPTVDVVNNADQNILVDDISYTEFGGYLDLPTQDYTINVEAADNSAVVQSYDAPLQTLGLSDTAVTVVASGFLDPVANQNGDAFGLWVALPAGGPLVELPLATIGTDEFADNNFSYYPNPVKQRLNLNTNGLVEDVTIYNMLGQEVIHVEPNKESPQINMSGLQAGAYMMKVNIDGASQSFRVIKE